MAGFTVRLEDKEEANEIVVTFSCWDQNGRYQVINYINQLIEGIAMATKMAGGVVVPQHEDADEALRTIVKEER